MSSHSLPGSPVIPSQRAVHTRSRFYVGMAVLMLVVVVAGFWPQYYGALLKGVALKPQVQYWVIHVHAVVFLGWLMCFLIQAVLIQRGRVDLHRRTGVFMAVYGFVAIIVGVMGGFAIALRKIAEGAELDNGAAFLFIPLSDMITFAGFLGAAIVYRRKPEIHKRLMLLAALTLTIVGMGRLLMHLFPTLYFEQRWLFALLFVSPLLLAMGYDLLTRRRVHVVYFIGALLFLPRVNILLFMNSEAWLSVGRALLRPFLRGG